MKRPAGVLLALAVTATLAAQAGSDDPLVLEPGFHHLGDDETPEWPEAPAAPESGPLVLRFEAAANAREHVLMLRQRHVSDTWTVSLNGREVARLDRVDALEERVYTLPAGCLVDGENVLEFATDAPADDITLGDVRLHRRPLREVFDLAPLSVTVSDDEGRPLPARLTLLDARGEPARLFGVPAEGAAARPGVLYSDGRTVSFELPRGEYTVHASRGTEWSHASAPVVAGGHGAGEDVLRLALQREVDTTGFIAADTHLHTLEISGHGDASLAERVLTLAGEGVELAIATDHNHNVDYTPHQAAAGLQDWYTPVVGNEVTTPIGHFNAFPLDPADEVPLHTSRDWAATVADMRAKGAACVILNHPRWPQPDTGPFGVEGLDELTGARATGAPFVFDAMELVNSTTEEPEPAALLRQWFALLDRGERIAAVGSSDSHTVGDPVGRGRTYVASASDDPAALDVDALAAAIAEGRSSVSLGMFVDVRQGGRSVMGHTLPATDGRVDLAMVLRAPSWARPERLEVFVNGRSVQTTLVNDWVGRERGFDIELPLVVEPPAHDAYVVVVAWGGPAGEAWWPGLNDHTLAIANPVRLDVDGDGAWSPPREVARARLADGPGAGDLEGLDEAAAVQYVELLDGWLRARARESLRMQAGPAAARFAHVRELLERLDG